MAVLGLVNRIWRRAVHWKFDQCYGYVATLATQADPPITFLNWGFASLEDDQGNTVELAEQDEPNRTCIQLYHELASSVPLQGLDVLEVSSGHGGGADYVARYLEPKSYQAIDRNRNAVRFCQRHYSASNLSFTHCSAESIHHDDNQFDVVINVEASHAYRDPGAFLREVERVLRPGGHLLLVDIRYARHFDFFEEELRKAGLQSEWSEDITPQVVRALSLNTPLRFKWINNVANELPAPACWLLKPAVRWVGGEWAGVEGSKVFRDLSSGAQVYRKYVIRKAPAATSPAPEELSAQLSSV